ncbi:hypothetical protein [Aliikangiella coralliicola]|uniref:Uncharacterized protein n=1 Tax=Aliikangiella coralliicola TaxID=2592383 RepID=A0A545U036_9GAMM|nr:hypothetical protein [Aliikangiella coralliicola]TQV82826.1 hypothetical protein FLL46_23955 [Aliikangiella coralliicola]
MENLQTAIRENNFAISEHCKALSLSATQLELASEASTHSLEAGRTQFAALSAGMDVVLKESGVSIQEAMEKVEAYEKTQKELRKALFPSLLNSTH